ncbi:MAG TPA: hypothetical protein DCS30_05850 [Rhizobiales bacterium]|nr:hypothetical protein [Hyphomicrobiales bacterium]
MAMFLPLFLSAALLLSSNGLLGTYVPVRAELEGFSTALIGWIGAAYYLGFMSGSAYSSRIVAQVGHIRTFAVFAALGATGALAQAIIQEPIAWAIIRMIAGFSFAGQFVVLESWLNAMADSKKRGQTMGAYRITDMTSVIVGQSLLGLADPLSFVVFAGISIVYTWSLIPIAISRQPTPPVPPNYGVSLNLAFKLSPLAFFGVFTAGLTNASFRAMGPTFAQSMNMSLNEIAAFMNAMLIGGALMQIPFGWMSDRINRRLMLIATAIGAALGGVLVSEFSHQGFYWALIGVFVFGCFAMPIYSLAMVHASDFAKKEEFVRLSASMLLLYGIGATIGPVVGAWTMDFFGPTGFFYFTTSAHLAFLILGFVRLSTNRAKPSGNITRFGFFPRTSPLVLKFMERKDRKDKKNSKAKAETGS